ncbi:MAG: NAD-dependent epimerase/dehydratase family protein, partial [Candidatus Gottesmanbacteria bacterium]
GSGAEYDKRFPIISVKEEDITKRIPSDEYGLFKYICAQYIECVKFIVDLRVFGMFGEGEDYQYRFISNALCRHMYHMPITMGQDVYFDYMDIQDFVRIIDYFIGHKPKHTAYNIGTGKKINLRTIANKINKMTGENGKIVVKKSGLNNEYTCDSSLLFSELKNFTLTPVESSLKRLSTWYLNRKDFIDKHNL